MGERQYQRAVYLAQRNGHYAAARLLRGFKERVSLSESGLGDGRVLDTIRPQGPPGSPQTFGLPAGHRSKPDCRALPSPIVVDQDQILTLRDGTTIRADIYRPKTDNKVPAIIMWGAYGKSGSGPLNIGPMPGCAGIPAERLSGYEDSEGLDPAEWVPRRYAIINYFIAALRPPHLTAIAPLEGLSDLFREQAYRGGIPYATFPESIAQALLGRQQQEDLVTAIKSTTTTNDYIEDKRVDMSKIQVPAYIGASYGNKLHVVGSFRAFEEIPHDKKWLAANATHEWHGLYTDERTTDLARFFDYFLRDVKNDWPQTPPVRLPIMRCTQPARLDTPFNDLPWHTDSAVRNNLYLRPDLKLSTEAPSQEGKVEYKASTDEKVTFAYTFPSKTVLTGPSTLGVDISSPDHDDLDVYAHLYKADKDGNILSHLNLPTMLEALSPEQRGLLTHNCLLRYWGPHGQLRASQRHVSPEKSGKTWKTLSYEKVQRVKPGDVVKLGIQLWPTGLQFEAGEQLLLTISGARLTFPALPGLAPDPNPNQGKHVLHLGGQFEGRLEFFNIDV
ncbi:Alpha/Beta hydrolase protein [Aspergillus carlsbadensis]|nr:Alpha/Beta hydrolase protein [Aspergillus carlsbadensis]